MTTPGRASGRVGAALTAVLVAAALLAAPGAASGQTLQGRVIDTSTEAPVGGATLQLLAPDSQVVASGLSGDTGAFVLTAPRAGEFLLTVERIGYQTSVLGPLRLRARGFLEVTVALGTAALPIEGVNVEVAGRVRALELAGFYDRRLETAGQFLERAEIEKLYLQRASDVLNTFQGVRVWRSQGMADVQLRGASINAFSGPGAPCFPAIYLDGGLASPYGGASTPGRINLDQLLAEDLEAVEVYAAAATVPAQFARDGSPCGVILLWRRAGQ